MKVIVLWLAWLLNVAAGFYFWDAYSFIHFAAALVLAMIIKDQWRDK